MQFQEVPDSFKPNKSAKECLSHESPWKSNDSNQEGLYQLKMSSKNKEDYLISTSDVSKLDSTPADPSSSLNSEDPTCLTASSVEKAFPVVIPTKNITTRPITDAADLIARPIPTARRSMSRFTPTSKQRHEPRASENQVKSLQICLGKRALKPFEHDCSAAEACSQENLGRIDTIHCSRSQLLTQTELGEGRINQHPGISRPALSKLCNLKIPRLSPRDLAAAQTSGILYPQGKLPQSESLLVDHCLSCLLANQGISQDVISYFSGRIVFNQVSFEQRAKQGALRARHSAQGALRKAKATAALLVQKIARRMIVSGSKERNARQFSPLTSQMAPHAWNNEFTNRSTCKEAQNSGNSARVEERGSAVDFTPPRSIYRNPRISMIVPGHSIQTIFNDSVPRVYEEIPMTPEKVKPTFLWSAQLSSGAKSVTQRTEVSRGDRALSTSKELLNSILAFRKQINCAPSDNAGAIGDKPGSKHNGDLGLHSTSYSRVPWEKSGQELDENSCEMQIEFSPSKGFTPFAEEFYVKPAKLSNSTTQTAEKAHKHHSATELQHSEPKTSGLSQDRLVVAHQEVIQLGSSADACPILFRKLTF